MSAASLVLITVLHAAKCWDKHSLCTQDHARQLQDHCPLQHVSAGDTSMLDNFPLCSSLALAGRIRRELPTRTLLRTRFAQGAEGLEGTSQASLADQLPN